MHRTDKDIADCIGGSVRWKNDHIRLFISHLSAEKAFAHDVRTHLAEFGIDGFVAHDDIPETAPWQREILEALETCDALALLLHNGFRESKWCDQEVGIAFEKGKMLVPVCFVRTEEGYVEDPHGFAGNFQKIDGCDLTAEQVARKIYRAMVNDEGEIGEKLKMALIRSLRDSQSFADAADRARRIKSHIHEADWREENLVRALSRTLRNDQVSNSFVASEIVNNVLEDNPLRGDDAGVRVFDPEIRQSPGEAPF